MANLVWISLIAVIGLLIVCDSSLGRKIHKKISEAPLFANRTPMRRLVAVPKASSARFRCPAIGNPRPNITWWKDNQPFVKRPFGSFRAKQWQLYLSNVIPDDNGNYTCVIQNKHGKIEHTFKLHVIQRLPTAPVLQGPRNQTVYLGETAVFECNVTSESHPHMQWVKHHQVNGSYKDPDGKPYIDVLQQSSLNKTNPWRLVLENVTMKDAGWYTCLATNYIGASYVSAWLTVLQRIKMATTQFTTTQRRQFQWRQLNSGCNLEADIMFVFDSSKHISDKDFKQAKELASDIVKKLRVGKNKARIGAMKFNDDSILEFPLNFSYGKARIIDAILDIQHTGTGSRAEKSLYLLRTVVFKECLGGRASVPDIAIFFTGGKFESPALVSAQTNLAFDDGIRVYSIGIGDDVNATGVSLLSHMYTKEYSYVGATHEELGRVRSSILTGICRAYSPCD